MNLFPYRCHRRLIAESSHFVSLTSRSSPARTDEVRKLVRLITIYRGIYFYGESGAGKSSVINAGLIPALRDEGFVAERVRVQPIAGQELVIERIALTNEGAPPFLPSRFAACADEKAPEPARVVLSVEEFIRCIEKTPMPQRRGWHRDFSCRPGSDL